jgi:hypothetical protein
VWTRCGRRDRIRKVGRVGVDIRRGLLQTPLTLAGQRNECTYRQVGFPLFPFGAIEEELPNTLTRQSLPRYFTFLRFGLVWQRLQQWPTSPLDNHHINYPAQCQLCFDMHHCPPQNSFSAPGLINIVGSRTCTSALAP